MHQKHHVESFVMNAFGLIRHVLCLLGLAAASLCASEVENEVIYADNYDNEISQHQQEEVAPTSFHAAGFSRWEKLFIALEDSHMRQNMLLESVTHLTTQVDQMVRGTCLCVPSGESACGAQVEQVRLRLQQEMDELREEEAQRETRLNATMQMLLSVSHEGNIWLKRLRDDRGDSRPRRQPTPTGASLGMKSFPSGLKDQEVTTPLCTTTVERAPVTMTTELEKIHLLLTRVMAQVETLRRDRGDA